MAHLLLLLLPLQNAEAGRPAATFSSLAMENGLEIYHYSSWENCFPVGEIIEV